MTGPDAWSKLAPTWRKDKDGVLQQTGIDSARVMIAEVNKVAPFAKAEAIHDIGCGNGTVVGELLKAYGAELPSTVQLVASDKSASMIAEAEEQQKHFVNGGEKIWSNLDVKILDAADMQEVKDDTFSHILGGNMLYAVSDYNKVVSEVKRTLKPGGLFAYSVNADTPWIRLMGLVAKVRPDKITPYPPPLWQTRESCMKILEDAGFKDVIGKTLDLHMQYDSPEEIVEYFTEVLPW